MVLAELVAPKNLSLEKGVGDILGIPVAVQLPASVLSSDKSEFKADFSCQHLPSRVAGTPGVTPLPPRGLGAQGDALEWE